MSRPSLEAAYFDGIFEHDDDPWELASSDYEAAKFDATHDALAGRRYARALEVGCAHGVLTEKLIGLCDALVAVDISSKARARTRERIGDRPGLELALMAFPKQVPDGAPFDLVVLSEVAYYWSFVDLERAGEWLRTDVAPGGRIILVHYLGETDYPQSGDEAVETLWRILDGDFVVEANERHERYRLDLWRRA